MVKNGGDKLEDRKIALAVLGKGLSI